MDSVQRFDAGGRLGKVKRTPQGGIEVAATLRKVGVLTYLNPDGSERREYVSPEELFKAQSLETLAHAPVTNLHPFGAQGGELVSPDNFRDHSIGHLTGQARKEQAKLAGDLVIQDQTAIALVDRGERNEVSLGYVCAFEPTPGVTPSGERYDGVQRNIVYNHVALVPRGRAGRDVALRLDSEGNQVSPERAGDDTIMKIEIIAGVEYEVGTPAHTKAKADAAQLRADAEDALKAATAERDQYKAELESVKTKFDSAVQERVTLLKLAESKGVEASGTNQEIRAAVLAKLSPSLKFDSADETYVRAALDVAMAQGNLTEAVSQAVEPEVRQDADSGLAPDVLARENMIRRLHNRPLIDRHGNVAE